MHPFLNSCIHYSAHVSIYHSMHPLFVPRCDADPAALSKYIVALLRKEKPRSALKELCVNQLEVFLSKGMIIMWSVTWLAS